VRSPPQYNVPGVIADQCTMFYVLQVSREPGPIRPDHQMPRTAKLLIVPLFLLQIFFFGFVALHRFIDADEGFYLLASRLVLMHKKPYLDFLFEQAPLLPYVYALWMKCFGMSWTSAKLFSALLTALLGTLLYEDVCRQTRNWVAGLSAAVMFAASTLVFGFFPVVKTYSLAGLFLFAAYVIVSRLSATSRRWLMGAGGLLFGLSVDTRSYLVLLAPLFLWWIFRNSDAGAWQPSVLWFLSGFTIAMVPCLYLFISSPDAFLFNNVGFHAIRSKSGLVGMWGQKFVVALMSFLGGPQGNGIQASLLFFISLAFVFSIHKRGYPPRFAFQIAVALGFISLLPTPVLLQYFALCIPFLLVSAICVLNDLFAELESRRAKLVAVAACFSLLGIYLAASANDFRAYLVTGDGVFGIQPDMKGDWRLQRVIEVSQAIDQIARPGEIVASFWPGHIFQTKTNPLPGLENDFGLPVSDKLSSQQRASYHILLPGEVEADFAAHRPRVVVLRDEDPSKFNGELAMKIHQQLKAFRSSLHGDGYILVRSIGGVSIYVCSSNP
jgi:Dolichyl-phosphate-mannose-protein mannosyltransferase